jgi:hypothetical protein
MGPSQPPIQWSSKTAQTTPNHATKIITNQLYTSYQAHNLLPQDPSQCYHSISFLAIRCPRGFSATGWTFGVLRFDSRRGLGIFLFTTASRPALGPTQPPIQWVPGALSLGVKRSGRGTITPTPQYAFMVWCSLKHRHKGKVVPLP